MKHGWGIAGATLGAWELAALTTGRVPTISLTVHRARSKRAAVVDMVVLLWAFGTVRHLLTYKP